MQYLLRDLWGTCKDVNGKSQSVAGDMTKVRFVPGFSDAALLLLRNIGHTVRKLHRTQETMRVMRFTTQAYRIRYGTSILVAFPQMKITMY
mgnify:CR=1 FL=1